MDVGLIVYYEALLTVVFLVALPVLVWLPLRAYYHRQQDPTGFWVATLVGSALGTIGLLLLVVALQGGRGTEPPGMVVLLAAGCIWVGGSLGAAAGVIWWRLARGIPTRTVRVRGRTRVTWAPAEVLAFKSALRVLAIEIGALLLLVAVVIGLMSVSVEWQNKIGPLPGTRAAHRSHYDLSRPVDQWLYTIENRQAAQHVRVEAIHRLSASMCMQQPAARDRRVVPALCEALRDSDLAVRQAAAEALVSVADQRAVAALTAAARSDPDQTVRNSAQTALYNIRSRQQSHSPGRATNTR